VSGILSSDEVMDVFRPGDHGSTFGGNPLGAAVGREALRVIQDEGLPERSDRLGTWFMQQLRDVGSEHVAQVRGWGLMVGVVIKDESGPARPFCEALQQRGILAKETHHQVIRFAPPLVIDQETLEWVVPQVAEVLEGAGVADRVATMVFSEFGRRVRENGSAGTDHGQGAPVFVLGGGVRGGMFGTPPDLGALVEGDVPFSTDFRSVYSALEGDWLGLRPCSSLAPLDLFS